MLSKYSISYIAQPQHHTRVLIHRTDDPVEAEEFLMHLLLAGARITEVTHEGLAMSGHSYDQMLRIAAQQAATLMLCDSLGIDHVEVKHRFGFAA